MQSRSKYITTWQYSKDVAIGATFYLDIGADHSTFQPAQQGTAGRYCAPVEDMPYFSLDVYTDDALLIDIQTGMQLATIATMATLTCAPVLQHNTIYNLPAPFNRDGFIILTGNWCRIQVRNTTGNLVSPFELQARAWN